MRRVRRTTTVAILAASLIAAAAPQAQAGTVASVYPIAEYGPLSYRPTAIKFGSGSTFRVSKWKDWGRTKAVGTGYLCDHCYNRGGIRASGKIILGSKKVCGADRVYTTFRLSFKGRQKRKAGFWKRMRARSKYAVLGCGSGGSNARVHLPAEWSSSAEYPTMQDFLPRFKPFTVVANNWLSVNLVGQWSGWGTATASATATAEAYGTWPECEDGGECERSFSVNLLATDPGHCGAYLTYRRLSIAATNPADSFSGWLGQLQNRSVTCQD